MAFERIVNNPKRSIGEGTLKLIHEFSKENSLSLVKSSQKLIELNKIKPNAKIGLSSFLSFLNKWKNDLKFKNIYHVKLLQIILDSRGIL